MDDAALNRHCGGIPVETMQLGSELSRHPAPEVLMEPALTLLSRLADPSIELFLDGETLNCRAPASTLTATMREEIKANKKAILQLLTRDAVADDSKQPAYWSLFPLTSWQQALYRWQTRDRRNTACNLPVCLRMQGRLERSRLQAAWDLLVSKFPILTARIVESESRPFHVLDPSCATRVEHHSVGHASQDDLLAYLRAQVQQPFDLSRGPLARIQLFTSDAEETNLLITVHQIIVDAASAEVLLGNLLECYGRLGENESVSVTEHRPSLPDFVAWEKAFLASEGDMHAEYWQEQLSGASPALGPLPYHREAVHLPQAELIEALPDALCRDIHSLSHTTRAPNQLIFLTCLQLLLYRYTRRQHVVVSMPVQVPETGEFDTAVGHFSNLLPMRLGPFKGKRFGELLRDGHAVMLDAMYHSSYPLCRICDSLNSSGAGGPREFSISYSFCTPYAAVNACHVAGERIDGALRASRADLDVEVSQRGESFSVQLRSREGSFSNDSLKLLLRHYGSLLKWVCNNPERLADDCPLSSEPYSPPRTDIERRLVALWSQLLGSDAATIGIHDNFFELGGQSVLATQLVAAIRQEFAAHLPLQALFEQMTIAKLAPFLEGTAQITGTASVAVETGEL
jgi:hypothetical protein